MNSKAEVETKIERGRIKKIFVYDITQEELFLLEQNDSASINLNFSIALLTSAISATIAYFTILDIEPSKLAFIVAVIFCGYTLGVLQLLIWNKRRVKSRKIFIKIRSRIEQDKEDSS